MWLVVLGLCVSWLFAVASAGVGVACVGCCRMLLGIEEAAWCCGVVCGVVSIGVCCAWGVCWGCMVVCRYGVLGLGGRRSRCRYGWLRNFHVPCHQLFAGKPHNREAQACILRLDHNSIVPSEYGSRALPPVTTHLVFGSHGMATAGRMGTVCDGH